jgi:hypothetical protein
MELKSIKSGSKLTIEESSKLSDKVIYRLLKDKVLGNEIKRCSFPNGAVFRAEKEHLQVSTQELVLSLSDCDLHIMNNYMECQIIKEIWSVSDLPTAKEGVLFTEFHCMCKSLDIEALPLQTRLKIPLYKEWINKEYPLLVKRWIDPPLDPPITIIEVNAIEQRPFPIDQVRDWFGIEIKP